MVNVFKGRVFQVVLAVGALGLAVSPALATDDAVLPTPAAVITAVGNAGYPYLLPGIGLGIGVSAILWLAGIAFRKRKV